MQDSSENKKRGLFNNLVRMHEEIQAKLRELETHHSVRILFACESGSRAWGFPSADSDFDVRFIYAHPASWYLTIDDQKDFIEIPVNEVLDINGWDIRKALRLFRSSNPPLYEWLQSPIVYSQNEAFTENIRSLMHAYFSLRAGMHHYLSMSRNAFADLQSDEVRIKKYFYCLRPLLAASWIADKQQMPPMEFTILRSLITDNKLQIEINNLLQLKLNANEKSTTIAIPSIQEYINKQISYCEEKAKSFAKHDTDTENLNKLFRSSIYEF